MTKWMAVLLLFCGVAVAQGPPPGGPPAGAERRMRREGGPPGGLMGMRWWRESRIVQAVGLSPQQGDQIEQILKSNEPQLGQIRQMLETQEKQLHDLLSADQPDSGQVNTQIDQIAQTRASLEKTNARMHLAIRSVLTPDQWTKLQAQDQLMHQHFESMMRERRDEERRQHGEPPAKPQQPPQELENIV